MNRSLGAALAGTRTGENRPSTVGFRGVCPGLAGAYSSDQSASTTKLRGVRRAVSVLLSIAALAITACGAQ